MKTKRWSKVAESQQRSVAIRPCGIALVCRCVDDRVLVLLMSLCEMPQSLRPAACRLYTRNSCVPRVRPLRKTGYASGLPYRNVSVQRQLTAARVVVRASGKEMDHAAVKPFRQLGLWTAIDAAATIGSIAGALAFITTSEAVLAGIPVILPLVAWYAGRQKEGLQVEVSTSLFACCCKRRYCIMLGISRQVLAVDTSSICMAMGILPPLVVRTAPPYCAALVSWAMLVAGCHPPSSNTVARPKHDPKCGSRQCCNGIAAAATRFPAATDHDEACQEHRGKAECA